MPICCLCERVIDGDYWIDACDFVCDACMSMTCVIVESEGDHAE